MSSLKKLSGKSAIVTGAAGGLGEAIAKALAGEGAPVAVAQHMMERKKGRIINIASRAGLAPNPGGPDYLPYGAAKTGVIGFTRLLARELDPYEITVNSISPSTALTQRVLKLRDPESLKKIADLAPIKHLVQPQDIAEAALFLASEGARYITGINLNVNSGNFMV